MRGNVAGRGNTQRREHPNFAVEIVCIFLQKTSKLKALAQHFQL
jgi:hypothetical protein